MPQLIQQSDVRNRLLAGLTPDAFALLQPDLQRSSLEQGTVLGSLGEPLARVYFPEPGVVSVVACARSGMRLEGASSARRG